MNYFWNVGYKDLLENVIIKVEESGEGMMEGYIESFKEYFKGREGDIISYKEYEEWSNSYDEYDSEDWKRWNWFDGLFGIDIELFNYENYYDDCCNKGMEECWDNDWEKLSFEMFLINELFKR